MFSVTKQQLIICEFNDEEVLLNFSKKCKCDTNIYLYFCFLASVSLLIKVALAGLRQFGKVL